MIVCNHVYLLVRLQENGYSYYRDWQWSRDVAIKCQGALGKNHDCWAKKHCKAGNAVWLGICGIDLLVSVWFSKKT